MGRVQLKHVAREIESKIRGVDDSLAEVEIFEHELLAGDHDEDMADVQLEVDVPLLVVEQSEGSFLHDEEKSSALELVLHGEVLGSEMLLPVVDK